MSLLSWAHRRLSAFLFCAAMAGSASAAPLVSAPPGGANASQMVGLQLPFIAAPAGSAVAFSARTFAGAVHVTHDGAIVYDLPGQRLVERPMEGRVAQVLGEGRVATQVNVLHGNDPAAWRRGVPAYGRVSLGEVYPGVVVRLHAHEGTVEKVLAVAPGGEAGRIRLRIEGGGGLSVTSDGALEIATANGPVRFSAPVAWQEHGEERDIVEVAYRIEGDSYGFDLGSYDPTRPLLIDPVLAATYYGGGGDDRVTGVVRDIAGDVYITGWAHFCDDLPGISSGAADPIHDCGVPNYREAFVARLDPGLTTVIAATFLGGAGDDSAWDIARAPSGDIYVTGQTAAFDFPGVGGGSADSTFQGSSEIFVARLSPDLSNLVDATYLGGSNLDSGVSVQVDRFDKVWVAGATRSSDFPGIGVASADSTFEGFGEAVVARLDEGLTTIEAATFLGGFSAEGAYSVLRSPAGRVYVSGFTRSFNFAGIGSVGGPGGNGGIPAADASFGGDSEAFVVRLDLQLETIQAATFLGGSDSFFLEIGYDLAEDSNGDVFVAGQTSSEDFPGIGPDSADSQEWDGEGFVVKLPPALGSILAATFLGGNSWSRAYAIARDGARRVWVAGGCLERGFVDKSSFGGAVLSNDLSKILGQECVSVGRVRDLALADTGAYFVGAGTRFGSNSTIGPGAADDVTVRDEGLVVLFDLGVPPALKIKFDSMLDLIGLLSPIPEDTLQKSLDRAMHKAERNRDRGARRSLKKLGKSIERLARRGLLDADEVSGLQGQLAPLEAELETSPEPLPRIREKPDNPIPGAWSGIRPFQLEMPEDHPLGGFDPPAGLRAPAAAGVP